MEPAEHTLPASPTPQQVTIFFARHAGMHVKLEGESHGLHQWLLLMEGEPEPIAVVWDRMSDAVERLLAQHSPIRLGECKHLFGASGYGIGPTVLGLMGDGWTLTFTGSLWRCRAHNYVTEHSDPEMAIALTWLGSHGLWHG